MNRVIIGNLAGTTNIAVGEHLPTRINCIVGLTHCNSPEDYARELQKIDSAARIGIDTITDLSMVRLRQPLWNYVKEFHPHIGVGINPTYLPFVEGHGKVTPKRLLQHITEFVRAGGDQMTVNFFPQSLAELETYCSGRLIPITSRQGAFLAVSMRKNRRNNPYWDILDELLPLLREFRVTVNLGATFRPAGIAEANDCAHRWELDRLLELHARFDEAGVQSLVEGISHLPLNEIRPAILGVRERFGRYVPFQALGPVVTDVHADDHDHIAAAIGMAEAARYNVGKITTIPPREHAGYPTIEDTEQGLIVAKLAVHAGDLCRLPHLIESDSSVLAHRAHFLTCDGNRRVSGCDKCEQFCPLILGQGYVQTRTSRP